MKSFLLFLGGGQKQRGSNATHYRVKGWFDPEALFSASDNIKGNIVFTRLSGIAQAVISKNRWNNRVSLSNDYLQILEAPLGVAIGNTHNTWKLLLPMLCLAGAAQVDDSCFQPYIVSGMYTECKIAMIAIILQAISDNLY